MSLPDTDALQVISTRPGLRRRLANLWRYRELLVGLVRTELKVKYKNSVLGFMWSMVNPLLYLVVFYIAFQIILGSGIPMFSIFLLSGLLVWNLFSVGLGAATGSVVGGGGLVKKVAFPREILPLASVGAALVHFFLQGLVLAVVLIIVRYDIGWSYLPLLPAALLVLLVLTAGLGILLAAMNVYLRDTAHFLELALLAWFWMTPIVYPYLLVADKDHWATHIFKLNPITWIVLIFQRAIYNKTDPGTLRNGVQEVARILPPDASFGWYAWHLGAVAALAAVTFLGALAFFGRVEGNFAEEL